MLGVCPVKPLRVADWVSNVIHKIQQSALLKSLFQQCGCNLCCPKTSAALSSPCSGVIPDTAALSATHTWTRLFCRAVMFSPLTCSSLEMAFFIGCYKTKYCLPKILYRFSKNYHTYFKTLSMFYNILLKKGYILKLECYFLVMLKSQWDFEFGFQRFSQFSGSSASSSFLSAPSKKKISTGFPPFSTTWFTDLLQVFSNNFLHV